MAVEVLRGIVLVLSIPAAYFDWRWRRIPNFLSLPALAAGLLAFVLSGGDPLAVLAALVIFSAWSFGWIGGGDTKLLMAYGLAFGPWPPALAAGLAGFFALLLRRSVPGAIFAIPALGIWRLWGS
ncbi:MAG: A24 family peptidase [Armatimonadota bacterium]|nr:A24 family peptidase [Armatimonadota bacterium]